VVTDEEETRRGGKGVIFLSEHPTTLEPPSGPRPPVLPAAHPPAESDRGWQPHLRRSDTAGRIDIIKYERRQGCCGLGRAPALHRHFECLQIQAS